jgi:hemolysin III
MGLRDPVSSASHLIVAVWAAYALLVLLRLTPASPARRLAAAVFGGSMVLLYTTSGVFHGVPFGKADHPAEFRFFQRLDQSAVLLLIAGTNTPLIVTLLGGAWRRWCLGGMWGLALAGVLCLWALPGPAHEAVVAVCLGMGWLGMLPVAHYYRALGWRAMNWVWAGCLLYTAGAGCELAEWPAGWGWPVRFRFHEVFHLLCAAASVAFFLFVARYVLPHRPTAELGPPLPPDRAAGTRRPHASSSESPLSFPRS